MNTIPGMNIRLHIWLLDEWVEFMSKWIVIPENFSGQGKVLRAAGGEDGQNSFTWQVCSLTIIYVTVSPIVWQLFQC